MHTCKHGFVINMHLKLKYNKVIKMTVGTKTRHRQVKHHTQKNNCYYYGSLLYNSFLLFINCIVFCEDRTAQFFSFSVTVVFCRSVVAIFVSLLLFYLLSVDLQLQIISLMSSKCSCQLYFLLSISCSRGKSPREFFSRANPFIFQNNSTPPPFFLF